MNFRDVLHQTAYELRHHPTATHSVLGAIPGAVVGGVAAGPDNRVEGALAGGAAGAALGAGVGKGLRAYDARSTKNLDAALAAMDARHNAALEPLKITRTNNK